MSPILATTPHAQDACEASNPDRQYTEYLFAAALMSTVVGVLDLSILGYLTFVKKLKGFQPLMHLSACSIVANSSYAAVLAYDLNYTFRNYGWTFYRAHVGLYMNNACCAAIGYIICLILIDKYICYAEPFEFQGWIRSGQRRFLLAFSYGLSLVLNLLWIPYYKMVPCTTLGRYHIESNTDFNESYFYCSMNALSVVIQYFNPTMWMIQLLVQIYRRSRGTMLDRDIEDRQVVSYRLHVAIAVVYLTTNLPFFAFDLTLSHTSLQRNNYLYMTLNDTFSMLQSISMMLNCTLACVVSKAYRDACLSILKALCDARWSRH